MKKLFLLFVTVILFGCQTDMKKYDDALCIQNITVVDPIDGLLPDQTVIIKDGKILSTQPAADIKLHPSNTIIDGKGQYLMPGLWDAHVHFVYNEALGPAMFDLFLAYGITSVRDTGGKIKEVNKYKAQADANPTRYPRVKVAGPLLDGMPNVYDGSPGKPELSVGLQDVNAVQSMTKDLIAQDVDLLKAYEMLTPEQLAAIATIARDHNLPVTGHIPLSMNAITASDAGMGCMEHMRNLEVSCTSNSADIVAQRRKMLKDGKNDPGGVLRSRLHDAHRQIAVEHYDDQRADEVFETFVKNETWQVPTLALNTAMVRRPFAQDGWSDDFPYMPQKVAAGWEENIKLFSERETTQWQKDYTDWMMMIMAKMHKAGVGVMAGTDCPIFFLTPGRSLHEELAMLVRAGLTPQEAIQTATINPARYFDMQDELGQVKAGMWADLVILDDNPLKNIDNTRSISAVIKQGEYYDRAELLASMVKEE